MSLLAHAWMQVLNYYQEHGTKIVKDHDQDTTDLEKCILLIQNNSSMTRNEAREVPKP